MSTLWVVFIFIDGKPVEGLEANYRTCYYFMRSMLRNHRGEGAITVEWEKLN